ncbi:MAG: hypothetical protein IPL78_24440 [Chloroflexi bacterium]|nr:hypothetical protein [Chloroflexota bacterium]
MAPDIHTHQSVPQISSVLDTLPGWDALAHPTNRHVEYETERLQKIFAFLASIALVLLIVPGERFHNEGENSILCAFWQQGFQKNPLRQLIAEMLKC